MIKIEIIKLNLSIKSSNRYIYKYCRYFPNIIEMPESPQLKQCGPHEWTSINCPYCNSHLGNGFNGHCNCGTCPNPPMIPTRICTCNLKNFPISPIEPIISSNNIETEIYTKEVLINNINNISINEISEINNKIKPNNKIFNVISAEFLHETNTFNKNMTNYKSFCDRFVYIGEDAIKNRKNNNTELSGFLDCKDVYNWNLIHVLSAHAEPSGMVTTEAFNIFSDQIINKIKDNLDNLDGVLLSLHGAMVVADYDDGEGELLTRIRNTIGNEIPIAITLDLHANCTDIMCNLSNIIVSFKTYPHIDMRECGKKAGDILHRAMLKEIKPKNLRCYISMLEESNSGRTDQGPMVDRYNKCIEYENNNANVLCCSINAGFPTDISIDVGPTVICTYDSNCSNKDLDQYHKFIQDIGDDIWNKRDFIINKFLSVEEACDIVLKHINNTTNTNKQYNNKPIIIADYSDNPGGGGYGDTTNLLNEMINKGISNAIFASIVDYELVKLIHNNYKVNDVIDEISLGGKFEPLYGGKPLIIQNSIVKFISNGKYIGTGTMIGGLVCNGFGNIVVLDIGNNIEVLITSESEQILDIAQLTTFNLNPYNKSLISLKSMQHFREAFTPISSLILVCDSGSLCTPDMSKLIWKNVKRPIYPLDK